MADTREGMLFITNEKLKSFLQKIQIQKFSAEFFFFQIFFFLLKMDLEPSTKALGCLKNPKFLIFDGKQHPEIFWFRGC